MSKSWLQLKNKLENCLCPPGNGVFTVNTAKSRKAKLHQHLFGQTEQIDSLWKQNLNLLPATSQAIILGIASDCGGGILRGANWGPLFIRTSLLEQYPEVECFDLGDIRVIPHLLADKYLNDITISKCRQALYHDSQSDYAVSPLTITEDILHDFYALFPTKGILALGGDHSISYPLTKAYLQAKKKQQKRVAIIHFDAHTDLLVERLGIDLCFGSWCTHILSDLTAPEDLIQIGIRSSGKNKAHWQNTFGVRQHWAHEIKTQGIAAITEQVLNQLAQNNIDEIYVSFDIDAIDDSYASATGTPEPDGLSPEEAMYLLKSIQARYPITGADMMEVAPFTDSTGVGIEGREQTLAVAAQLSAFLLQALTQSASKE